MKYVKFLVETAAMRPVKANCTALSLVRVRRFVIAC